MWTSCAVIKATCPWLKGIDTIPYLVKGSMCFTREGLIHKVRHNMHITYIHAMYNVCQQTNGEGQTKWHKTENPVDEECLWSAGSGLYIVM